MIDVHMLTLPGDRKDWKEQAIANIPGWATLHVIKAKEGPIGPQRLKAFRKGKHKYVSCIDPDDWVEPYTFELMLEALQQERHRGVCCRELVHDSIAGSTYLCPFKHQTYVLRRDFVEERADLFSFDIEERHIINTPEVKWLPFIGHHWRRYNSPRRQRKIATLEAERRAADPYRHMRGLYGYR